MALDAYARASGLGHTHTNRQTEILKCWESASNALVHKWILLHLINYGINWSISGGVHYMYSTVYVYDYNCAIWVRGLRGARSRCSRTALGSIWESPPRGCWARSQTVGSGPTWCSPSSPALCSNCTPCALCARVCPSGLKERSKSNIYKRSR